MLFTKSSILALALATPALSCVDFHADYHYQTFKINAALTDNGQQKCTLINYNYGLLISNGKPVPMNCLGGYHAELNAYEGWVHFWYGSFDGYFRTDVSDVGSTRTLSAKVWGC